MDGIIVNSVVVGIPQFGQRLHLECVAIDFQFVLFWQPCSLTLLETLFSVSLAHSTSSTVYP